jgi:hypothetical protein
MTDVAQAGAAGASLQQFRTRAEKPHVPALPVIDGTEPDRAARWVAGSAGVQDKPACSRPASETTASTGDAQCQACRMRGYFHARNARTRAANTPIDALESYSFKSAGGAPTSFVMCPP